MKAAVNRFVLDASVAVAWCFDDESTPFTEGILDLLSAGADGVAPGIWPLEVAKCRYASRSSSVPQQLVVRSGEGKTSSQSASST